MDWNSITWDLFLIGFGVLIGSIKDIGKDTVGRLFRMIGSYFNQKLIEKGLNSGDFEVTFGKFRPRKKEIGDSEWSIRVLHPHKNIEKCSVVFGKKRLLWNKEKHYNFIIAYGGANIPLPEKDFNEKARVQLWDGKKILKNRQFQDLPELDE